MRLFARIKTFFRSDRGAVTVDWVVLTAVVVGLGLLVKGEIEGAITTLAGTISASMQSAAD